VVGLVFVIRPGFRRRFIALVAPPPGIRCRPIFGTRFARLNEQSLTIAEIFRPGRSYTRIGSLPVRDGAANFVCEQGFVHRLNICQEGSVQ